MNAMMRQRWPLAHLGAWSRGWTARFWSMSKNENPFRTDQVLYRELWLDGWQAADGIMKANPRIQRSSD